MKTSLTTLALLALPLFAALSGACTASSTDDDETSAQDLTSHAAPIGLYILQPGSNRFADRWINAINLHHDGTFDGWFGNDVSNLSGHAFLANGTYKVETTADGPAIAVSSPGSHDADHYLFKATPTGFDFKFVAPPGALPAQPWFSMGQGAAPITLNFAADFSESQSAPVVKNGTLLIRYAASRQKCGGPNAAISAFVSVDGQPAQVSRMAESVNGFIDLLVGVGPEGKDLAVWFQNSNGPGCSSWDSNDSKNYHFKIQ